MKISVTNRTFKFIIRIFWPMTYFFFFYPCSRYLLNRQVRPHQRVGETVDLRDLMLLHTQRQGSNPRQLVKGK